MIADRSVLPGRPPDADRRALAERAFGEDMEPLIALEEVGIDARDVADLRERTIDVDDRVPDAIRGDRRRSALSPATHGDAHDHCVHRLMRRRPVDALASHEERELLEDRRPRRGEAGWEARDPLPRRGELDRLEIIRVAR